MQFEALRQFNDDERRVAEGVLESLINNHQAKRLFAAARPSDMRTATRNTATSAKRASR